MSSVFLGIMIATILMAATPMYIDALERQSIDSAVESALERAGDVFFSIRVTSDFVPLEGDELDRTGIAHAQAINANIGPIHLGTRHHLRTPLYTMLLPHERLAGAEYAEPQESRGEREQGTPGALVQGFLQHYEDIDQHVTFLDGRPLADAVMRGTQGPMVEALVSSRTAAAFGGLLPGDVVLVASSLESPLKVSARIVGLVEATDAREPYWYTDADEFLFPRIPAAGGEITKSSPPALGLFVGRDAMASALGAAFPGASVDSTWYSDVDPNTLKTWSKEEMRARMGSLREDLSLSLPDVFIFSGIDVMLAQFGRKSFLASIPLLLLLAVLGVAVLYFLFMIVSYVVPNRESDVALFRSRGAGIWRILRLYAAEGAVLVLVAAAIAPGPALLLVWLAGLLPHFGHITGGSPLPVHLSWMPFAAAAVSGALCLIVFVVPGVMGARAGLIIHRLRSSRPPPAPLIQRHYIDLLILAVGAVLFWELWARGELVSGSLFGQQDVNEALLIAPVLFLMTVGMLFLRIFPMFIRYVSGESPALIHVAAVVTLAALAAGIGIADFRAGDQSGWVLGAAAIGGVGAAYWITFRVSGRMKTGLWTAVQAVIILWFLYMRPPDPDASAAVFAGTIALAALVPAQLLFFLLAHVSQRAPIWVSLGLWHIARNPLQYSWLVLLLVIGGGIGILATTVGATLDRSYEERVRYTVGSDVRVHNLHSHLGRRDGTIEQTFGTIPGVRSLSVAVRDRGRLGVGQTGTGFSFLAVESDNFDGWYRGDFSEDTLGRVLSNLEPRDAATPVLVPDGPDLIQMWVSPASFYPLIFVWVVVRDASGKSDTISLGELDAPGWNLMSAELPEDLVRPLEVVSIQINEPGFGATGTVGEVLFDDLQAVTSDTEEVTILEGFEQPVQWFPLATTEIGSDEIARVSDAVHSGAHALRFSFGKETNRGLRGMYRSSGSGFMPVVASSTFAAATGATLNSGLLVSLPGGIVPVEVTAIVDYFPTMDPAGRGFLIFDVQTLLAYTDNLSPTRNSRVNEIFLETEPGSGTAVLRDVDRRVRYQGQAIGTEAALAAQAVDPLISAGWHTIVLVAVGVVLFIAGLGYVVYLTAFADRGVAEMASLRSLGLSRFQTIGLIGFEQLLVALTGLALGTWSGFQMSRMVVSSVAVTEGGGRVLPPFVLTTDWTLMVPLYGALIAIFVLSLLTLGGRVLSLDLRSLSRLEE